MFLPFPIRSLSVLLLCPCAWAQGVSFNAKAASEGYRLIAPLNRNEVKLIDRQGQNLHEWASSCITAATVTLQEDGLLLRTCLLPNSVIAAGGHSGRLELLDWESKLVWEFEYNSNSESMHHDVKRMPNGNYLILVWHHKTRDEALAAGADPDRVGPRGLFSERVLEVSPQYPSGGEIVWAWDLWDHFGQNQPERVNLNYTADRANPDWFHANAIDYNPGLDQILISVRNASEIWIIDHSTSTETAAGSSGGRYGRGGDLLYRWGNPSAWMAGGAPPPMIDVQHNAHWIEPGLPGEGNLLIFSNLFPGVDQKSFVLEIQSPLNPDGSYQLEEGAAYGPFSYQWAYAAAEPDEFFSPFISGMQRLPNGNTLVCSGMQATVFEITPNGEVLWQYSEAPPGNSGNILIFRAYWYPASYPGLAFSPFFQVDGSAPR